MTTDIPVLAYCLTLTSPRPPTPPLTIVEPFINRINIPLPLDRVMQHRLLGKFPDGGSPYVHLARGTNRWNQGEVEERANSG